MASPEKNTGNRVQSFAAAQILTSERATLNALEELVEKSKRKIEMLESLLRGQGKNIIGQAELLEELKNKISFDLVQGGKTLTGMVKDPAYQISISAELTKFSGMKVSALHVKYMLIDLDGNGFSKDIERLRLGEQTRKEEEAKQKATEDEKARIRKTEEQAAIRKGYQDRERINCIELVRTKAIDLEEERQLQNYFRTLKNRSIVCDYEEFMNEIIQPVRAGGL